MPEIALLAEPREQHGTPDSRRLRATGRVPAVVYGHGADPLPVSVDARQLRHALGGAAGSNALLDLHVGSERHLVIARELQHHPVRHTVSHVDFQVVRRDEVVSAEVPLHLVGEATELVRAGGTVEHVLLSIAVHARPADIPSSLEIDISALGIGQALHVGDLPALSGVSFDADPETVVVVAAMPRSAADAGESAGESASADGA